MKFLVWLISAVNLWFGIQCALNVFGVLQNSKYSPEATKIFTLMFILMGLAGIYWSVFKPNIKLALLISLGPWIVAILILLITMISSDYK